MATYTNGPRLGLFAFVMLGIANLGNLLDRWQWARQLEYTRLGAVGVATAVLAILSSSASAGLVEWPVLLGAGTYALVSMGMLYVTGDGFAPVKAQLEPTGALSRNLSN